MTPRERLIAAFEHQPPTGRVPHFELVFFLTMEAFGKVHPSHRSYHQWDQMEEKERQLHREDMAGLYVAIAERYEHCAIFLHGNPNCLEEAMRLADVVREKSGDRFFLMRHGDATYSIPSGSNMEAFAYRLVDEPQKLKDDAARRVDDALATGERLAKHGAYDGFALCADYCLNDGPFLSPNQFAEFVAPYLKRLITGYREQGFRTIKHTDGNIMPILDQLVDCEPDALHSLDPQGGVDLAAVKQRYGGRVCLIGNVNCGLLDTGTDEEVVEAVRDALRHGMPGGGYVLSTSNCIYAGMALRRYELMLDVWRREGNY